MTGRPMRQRRAAWVALARALNTLYFAASAAYCLLTYSSFAYQQFIRPRMVASLGGFVAFHHLWHWVALGLTVLSLLPEWRCSRGRGVAWGYVGAMMLAGVALLVRPVLPAVDNDSAGLWLAFAFLVPPAWLAVYDHLSTWSEYQPARIDSRVTAVSGVLAGGVVWATSTVSVPFRFEAVGDYTTSGPGLFFGAAISLALHLAIFAAGTAVLLVTIAILRRWLSGGGADHCALALVTGATTLFVFVRLVFAGLSFTGWAAWLLAFEAATLVTLTWSAVAIRLNGVAPRHAITAWLAPVPGAWSRRGGATGVLLLPLASFASVHAVERFDWNFLVQNLCVIATWLLAAAFVHAAAGMRSFRVRGAAVLASVTIAAVTGLGAMTRVQSAPASSTREAAAADVFVPEFALDAYAALEPSYRLIRALTAAEPPGAAAFFRTLAAHSLIQHVDVAPVVIAFTPPNSPPSSRPPHLFLFVIDSLRRDYLSPYNPRVTFTPAFGRFAEEDLAFQHAFTRYGGTGLSMPAIWAGSMILHKEYVQPFAPMNALEKLIRRDGYRALISMDHITAQLLSPDTVVEELDRGRPEMQHDFCTTLEELQSRLAAPNATVRPVFAHTRSLDLHISKLTERVGAPDPAFGGFQAPTAAAVQRMDGCFGRFITFLKARRLYDDSIVVVTSDHGDALGEAKRWGHAYTLFPEVVRTPLLMHVPSSIRSRYTTDVTRAAFSTDITPSLYALLGYDVPTGAWPLGRSLFTPVGRTAPLESGAELLASSYGPVYAVLQDNGRALYIADGVNRRDYAYDISGLKPRRVGVTPESRDQSRAIIQRRLAHLAALYHFTPGS